MPERVKTSNQYICKSLMKMKIANTLFCILMILVVTVQGCGFRPIAPPMFLGRSGRILGGRMAHDGEWPWEVYLHTTTDRFCGGSLLDHQWVITAAHCVFGHKDIIVRIGAYNRSSLKEKRRHLVAGLSFILIHPLFDKKTYLNDIALLKLNISVDFTNYIQPVCLPNNSQSFQDKTGYLSGWGAEREASFEATSKLKVVELPVLDNDFCKLLLSWASITFNLSDDQFCAGFIYGGDDGCLGDSGGGFVVEVDNFWTLAGIMSSGWGCGRPFQPGIYTNVSQYIDWISNNMIQFS